MRTRQRRLDDYRQQRRRDCLRADAMKPMNRHGYLLILAMLVLSMGCHKHRGVRFARDMPAAQDRDDDTNEADRDQDDKDLAGADSKDSHDTWAAAVFG